MMIDDDIAKNEQEHAVAEAHQEGFDLGKQMVVAMYRGLAARYRDSAKTLRIEGTWDNGWPFYQKFVAPKWEEAAKELEAAATAIELVANTAETFQPSDQQLVEATVKYA